MLILAEIDRLGDSADRLVRSTIDSAGTRIDSILLLLLLLPALVIPVYLQACESVVGSISLHICPWTTLVAAQRNSFEDLISVLHGITLANGVVTFVSCVRTTDRTASL